MALDPQNFLSYPVWLDLPQETRYKIADLFHISPRGVRHVVDNRVVSDAFVHSDLAVITKERMSEITGVKSDDFYELFNALVKFVNEPKVETQNISDVSQKEPAEVVPGAKKKAGRPRKGAKAAGSDNQG